MGAYLVFQFSWWAYLLVDLNTQLQLQHSENAVPFDRWSMMIIGEGIVFLGLLMLGLWFVWRGIRKDQNLAKHERNFLLAVTHELKTPIAAMRLAVETLRRQKNQSEAVRDELLDEALQGAQRLERRVEDILRSTRIQKGESLQVEPVDVEEIIEAVIRHTRIGPYADRDVHVELHGEPQGLVDGDAKALELAWSNILENALKYSPEVEPVHLQVHQMADSVAVNFDDGGPGIPSHQRKEVVKKFRRLEDEIRRSSEGSGLGLYLANSIFRLHGGRMVIRASERGGTLVEIKIWR